jgi:hypothetical protein
MIKMTTKSQVLDKVWNDINYFLNPTDEKYYETLNEIRADLEHFVNAVGVHATDFMFNVWWIAQLIGEKKEMK